MTQTAQNLLNLKEIQLWLIWACDSGEGVRLITKNLPNFLLISSFK